MNTIPPGAPAPGIESLSVITYQQQPVVTTELLARLYGTGADNIHANFRRNADRFVDGKHFHKLEGAELREFKRSRTDSKSVCGTSQRDFESCCAIPRNVNSLLLWTERGAARHAKMLDTEQAWEVFEKLEDCYFSAKTPAVARKPILTRDDLSFTRRDAEGRMINWSVTHDALEDWGEKFAIGQGFLKEVAELATRSELDAYNAVQFALSGGGDFRRGQATEFTNRGWGEECGFAEAVARAVIDGLRARESGQAAYDPKPTDSIASKLLGRANAIMKG